MINRVQMIEEIKDNLWRVLSSGNLSSAPSSPNIHTGIDEESLRDLSFGIFSVSSQLEGLLAIISAQLRTLPSRSVRLNCETDGFVRGTVNWERTLQLRIDRNCPTVFIDSDNTRDYDHLRSRAIKYLISRLLMIIRNSPSFAQNLDKIVVSRRRQLEVLISHRKLSNVKRMSTFGELSLASLESREEGQTIAYWIRFIDRILAQDDLESLTSLFAENLLTPSKDDILFEILVGFRIVSYFDSIGYSIRTMQFIPQSKKPFCVLANGTKLITIWYQRSINAVVAISSISSYTNIRELNGLSKSSLRPDFVITANDGTNYIIEVKYSVSSTGSHVRAGITDVMAYLVDTPIAFGTQKRPKAIVVASDTPATPSSESDIIIASQETLHLALSYISH